MKCNEVCPYSHALYVSLRRFQTPLLNFLENSNQTIPEALLHGSMLVPYEKDTKIRKKDDATNH